MMPAMQERIRGGMVGVAVGDALGATVEFMSRAEIKAQYGYLTEIIGGGWLALEAGETTDDTAMTIGVARGILRSPQNPLPAIGEEFLRWAATRPKDIGNSTRAALQAYLRLGDWAQAAQEAHAELNGRSAGNGSLMRVLPVALAYPKQTEVARLAAAQSRMTHYDPLAAEVCVLYCRIASALLTGQDLQSTLSQMLKETEYRCVFNMQKSDLVADGYVKHTFQCAIWALLQTDNFADAVSTAVNLGLDADTTGAVTGGLAGVYYGYTAIPERWRMKLKRHQELIALADRLYQLRQAQVKGTETVNGQ